MQDLQILAGAVAFVAAGTEAIVGHAEPRRREQIVAVGIIRERARLADQRIDDVPIIDEVLVAAHQPRQCPDALIREPDLDAVGKKPRFDLLVDQPTVHRVDVAVDVNQAAAVHATRHFQTRRRAG